MGGFLRILLLACGLIAPSVPAQNVSSEVTAELSASTSRLYTDQDFTLVLTIRSQGVTLGKDFRLDGLNAADVLELGQFQELPASQTQIGGQTIDLHQFRCRAHTLKPATVTLVLNLQYQVISQVQAWYGPTTFQSTQHVPVQPLTLTVLPLPQEGRPPDFSGAVGHFTLSADAHPRDVALGDLVTVILTVRGDGRLEGAAGPTLAPDRAFKVYPPKLVGSASPGVLRLEQVIIPESTNALATPAARFTYFDADAGAYRTLTASGIPLRLHARQAAPTFVPYRPDAATASTGTQSSAVTAVDSLFPRGTGWRGWWSPARAVALTQIIGVLASAMLAMAIWFLGLAVYRLAKHLPWRGAGTRGGCLLAAAALASALAITLRHGTAGQATSVLARGVPARLGPSPTSPVLADLEAGAQVQVTERWDAWARVRRGSQNGWVPVNVIGTSSSNTNAAFRGAP